MTRYHLLEKKLASLERSYALARSDLACPASAVSPSWRLLAVLEQARQALAQQQTVDPALADTFTQALAELIQHRLNADSPDFAWLAKIHAHESAQISQYLALDQSHAQQQSTLRRRIHAFAHPGKLGQQAPSTLTQAYTTLYDYTQDQRWHDLDEYIQTSLLGQKILPESVLQQLLDPTLQQALQALLAHQGLQQTPCVKDYLALVSQSTLPAGSPAARSAGKQAQQQGAQQEQAAALALKSLAAYLSEAEHCQYRVLQSLLMPAVLINGKKYAKSEWDLVLVREAAPVQGQAVWDICLLIEAKNNPLSALSDFARLQRGLLLLKQAPEHPYFSFNTADGPYCLSRQSLQALSNVNTPTGPWVLYCCPDTSNTRLPALGAEQRMQLLSAPESLTYAKKTLNNTQPHTRLLHPLWQRILDQPSWHSLLSQSVIREQVAELIVTPEALAQT